MGKTSRTKGAAGEREFAKLIRERTGVELKRNLTQYQQSGDADLLGIDWAAIEIKRHRTALDAQVLSWWTETVDQAKRVDRLPVLAYRPDKQSWKVVMPRLMFKTSTYNFDDTMTITLPAFADMVRMMAEEEQEVFA